MDTQYDQHKNHAHYRDDLNYSSLDDGERQIDETFYYLMFVGCSLIVSAQLAFLGYVCYKIYRRRRRRKIMRVVIQSFDHIEEHTTEEEMEEIEITS